MPSSGIAAGGSASSAKEPRPRFDTVRKASLMNALKESGVSLTLAEKIVVQKQRVEYADKQRKMHENRTKAEWEEAKVSLGHAASALKAVDHAFSVLQDAWKLVNRVHNNHTQAVSARLQRYQTYCMHPRHPGQAKCWECGLDVEKSKPVNWDCEKETLARLMDELKAAEGESSADASGGKTSSVCEGKSSVCQGKDADDTESESADTPAKSKKRKRSHEEAVQGERVSARQGKGKRKGGDEISGGQG